MFLEIKSQALGMLKLGIPNNFTDFKIELKKYRSCNLIISIF